MRILAWLAVGFAASCALAGYQMIRPELGYCAVVILLGGILFWCGRHRKWVKAAALLLAGFGAGGLWYQAFASWYLQPAATLDGVTTNVRLSTTDYSSETDYGRRVDGRITLEGKSYSVRIFLNEGEELLPGTALQGSFRFQMTTPDSREGRSFHSGKSIFLLAYQEDVVTTAAEENRGLLVRSAFIRRRIGDILRSNLPENVHPFAKALLLGDTTDLTYEMDTWLKVSGIRHVAAVSGLHVSILFALSMHLALRKRFLSAMIGLPLLFFFAAVAGFTPSVTRACLMSALMLLALVVKREYDGNSALAFSALVMLLFNPLMVTDLSFQLSCASVAGILLFTGPIIGGINNRIGEGKGRSFSARMKRWLARSVATSLSAMIFTIPLCAVSFGTVSLIGVLTNLLTLGIISVIFYGLMGLCLVGLVHSGIAAAMGLVLAIPIRFVLMTAKILSQMPFGCVYTASDYIVWWLIFLYAVIFVWVIGKKKGLTVPVSLAVIGLCLAQLCAWAEPMLYGASITVLDVGQGQCVLLQSEGKNYLVDCGGSDDAAAADTAAQWLLSQGITSLDGIIVTHPDRDHIGGLDYLLTRIHTQILILPPVYSELGQGHSGVIYADREMILQWGSATLRILPEKKWDTKNENSLCILLDTENCDILITGDRNEKGEAQLVQDLHGQPVDILVAGHHGSKNAASETLLQAVSPEIVCISVGADNSYGHPAPQTLNRLYRHGCRVYRTDLHGTITIRR